MPEGVYRFARCRNCSTLYVDNNVTDSYLEDFYKNEFIEKNNIDSKKSVHDMIVEIRTPDFIDHWNQIKSYLPPTKSSKLLDIGSQTGEFGSLVLADGVTPNGLDLSEDYVNICQSKWGTSSVVFCGHIENSPFGSMGGFEYITSFETLEHVCAPIEKLKFIKNWLSPTGIIAISVPASDYFHFKFWLLRRQPLSNIIRNVFAKKSEFYNHQILPHSHIYNFSHKSLNIMLDKAGYEVLHVSLSGWHGPIGFVGRLIGNFLKVVSNNKICFAPSLFAIAKTKQSS